MQHDLRHSRFHNRASLIDQLMLSQDIRENKTNMTSGEQIGAILQTVKALNRRKDAVYENLMEKLEEEGFRLVDFRKIGKKEGEYLENYFDSEIAPLISPTVVGKRQPFPFLKNKDIYAVVVLEGKMVRKSLALFLVVPMYSQD